MENLENENENKELTVANESNYSVMGFDGIGGNSQTKTNVFTNIDDEKLLYNLGNRVDTMINDCEGEKIRVNKVLIKQYLKPMKEPVIDPQTGEIIKDTEMTFSCVIVDDNNKSYATGSKIFTIQLMQLLQMRAATGKANEMFDIKIIRKKVGQNGNKALGFELV